jgi:uncharacterized protein YjiS (DUF1127 family)
MSRKEWKDRKMASTVYHDFGGRAAGHDHAQAGLWARLGKRLADHRLYQRTRDELEALSDRDLADLGLTRFAIRDVAWESVYGA